MKFTEIKQIGPIVFVFGIVISGLAGVFWPSTGAIALLMACFGVIVGLLNINDKEVNGFLLASIAFTISAVSLGTVFGQITGLGSIMPAYFKYIVAFVGPAAGIVGLKQIWMLAIK